MVSFFPLRRRRTSSARTTTSHQVNQVTCNLILPECGASEFRVASAIRQKSVHCLSDSAESIAEACDAPVGAHTMRGGMPALSVLPSACQVLLSAAQCCRCLVAEFERLWTT